MKEKIEAYDECLNLIDRMLRNQGRSNVFMRSNIEHLRNEITELQEAEEKKDEEDLNKMQKEHENKE